MSYMEHRILAWACDEPGCPEQEWSEDSTVRVDRAAMRKTGWTTRRINGEMVDLCPKCSREKAST